MLTGIRDKTKCENKRLIYENDEINVSHSMLDGKTKRLLKQRLALHRHPFSNFRPTNCKRMYGGFWLVTEM